MAISARKPTRTKLIFECFAVTSPPGSDVAERLSAAGFGPAILIRAELRIHMYFEIMAASEEHLNNVTRMGNLVADGSSKAGAGVVIVVIGAARAIGVVAGVVDEVVLVVGVVVHL